MAVAIGCGSASDSSGTGGRTGNSGGGNSGGAGTSGGSAGSSSLTAGNASGGSSNGQQQAGASSGGSGNETGGASGEEGGAGGGDSPGEGGSGGASNGGESGSGDGGESGSTPDAWTACTDSNECVLTPMTCCGSCGAVTPEDAAAVNAQYLEEFRDAACGGPSICPACIMDDDPRVGTYCNDGHCIVELALD